MPAIVSFLFTSFVTRVFKIGSSLQGSYRSKFHTDIIKNTDFTVEVKISCAFYSDSVADVTQALQRLTEAPHVASLSNAVSRATSRISAMSERSSQEFPIPGKLLHKILKVCTVQLHLYHAKSNNNYWPMIG